jgi:transcriptional regulator with GAF, ATPase, and Fis domain
MSRETLVASTFVELADTLDDNFEVLDLLQNLVDRSIQILDASAACLTLADARGELRVVASTHHAAQVLELIALANAEGPCLDAFTTGEPVVNVAPADAAARWPRFVRAARELDLPTAHAVPLRIRNQVLGALSLLFSGAVELSADDEVITVALVKVASIGLLQERTPRQRELLAERLQGALDERVVLEQAKGIVAELAGVDMESAFRLIRRHSLRHREPLSITASHVLDGDLTLADLDPYA